MKCSCCGRRRKIREVFESVSDDLNICIECGQLIYKMRDAEKEGDNDLREVYLSEIRKRSSKKGSEEFAKWFDSEYIK